MTLAILKRGKLYYLKAIYTDINTALNKGKVLIKTKKTKRFIVRKFRGGFELWTTK